MFRQRFWVEAPARRFIANGYTRCDNIWEGHGHRVWIQYKRRFASHGLQQFQASSVSPPSAVYMHT